jgi:soluble lytic murein transglycosylase-like protein
MDRRVLLVFIGIVVISVAIAGSSLKASVNASERVRSLEAEVGKIKSDEEYNNSLGQYILNLMHNTSAGAQLSQARKQILTKSIVRVANDVFAQTEHKHAFAVVLSIESEFMKYAHSSTGPRGLSQVAKAAFLEGLKYCGIENVKDDDIWETDINLYAGACYFRNLIERFDGDPMQAIAIAYNQGPNSKDAKTYSKSGRADNIEGLKYIARFTYLTKTVTDKIPQKGAPDIKSMASVGKVNDEKESLSNK